MTIAVERRGERPAVQWAAGLHGRQRREADRAALILHPLEVAALLSGRGYDDDVIVAGVLHDVLEKTSATASELRTRSGTGWPGSLRR